MCNRRTFAAMFIAAGLAISCFLAFAGSSENITISVKVAPSLSISLSGSSISLRTVGAGSTTASSEAVVVTNDGSGVPEKFSLALTGSGNWTAGTTPGDETFVLNADFSETAAAATWQPVDSTVSDPVACSGSQKLWFQFQAPTTTVHSDQQSLEVTVSAELP